MSTETVLPLAAKNSAAIRTSSRVRHILLNPLSLLSRIDDLCRIVAEHTTIEHVDLLLRVLDFGVADESCVDRPALVPHVAAFACYGGHVAAVEACSFAQAELVFRTPLLSLRFVGVVAAWERMLLRGRCRLD
jgi:hypothetical protein